MSGKNKQDKFVKTANGLTSTGIVIIVIFLLLIGAYLRITKVLTERSISRMEEGVNTVIEEITTKLERDSRILNATANILSQPDNFDIDAALSAMKANAPLFETMRLHMIMEDETVFFPDGSISNAREYENISFAMEAPLGEHISNRVLSMEKGEPILRHFVPIIQNGKTVALLYGVTELEKLPNSLNVDHLYNAKASVYIIDTKSGDLIVDTFNEGLGNIKEFSSDNSVHETKGKGNWDTYLSDLMNLNKGYVVFRTPKTNGWQYLYYAPAGINQWSIAVSVPEKEAFTSVHAVQMIWMYLGAMLSLTIFLYYLWMRRNAKILTQQAVEKAVLTEKLQKAEAADRAKSTFLSNMSHDIRTPMNAIIGYTTLVQTNLDNRERTQEYLRKILSSSNHMLSLINDVLDMSRIESGKLNIEEKECTISDIFRDLRNIIQTQMQNKQLSFFMDTVDVIDEDIYCDKLHLNQVLLNLLSNAMKFTPAGGTVSLTIQQKPTAPKGYGSYEICVKDTGIGMSPEFIEHIFEPFERERNTTVSGIQGTGLGMPIAKNIVNALGGTIEVKSEQGKGTEFVLNFDFRLINEPQHIEEVSELRGLRALVADDSFTTCDNVSKMLHRLGMRAEWVMHGKEAVLHAKQAHELGDDYNAYIIDWFMPDLSGLEVVRQIRAIVGDDTPIIIVTAYDWTDFEDEARAAGVTAFCNKPIFLSVLRDILVSATTDAGSDQYKEPKAETIEDLKGTRLLLVEDNELNREIAEELLTERGFVVDKAVDGEEAVEKVKHADVGQYELIIMDIQMPKMNGYEATREIRKISNPKLANIPIIAMTANAFDEDQKQALESGMNAHVSKPIDIEKLVDVIGKTVKKDR
ncbi:MAG: response regulator [Oscillospiraceae bacterium]|nr:response regulator [Oscillospiraceae bacterium]